MWKLIGRCNDNTLNVMDDISRILRNLIPLLIPIVGIVFGCTIAIVAIITSHRRRKHLYALYHEERMAAINKGMAPPPLPDALLLEDHYRRYRSPQDSLRRGLIWLLLGTSIYFVVRANEGSDKALYGLILVAIGVANLAYYFIAGRKTPIEPPKNPEGTPSNPLSGRLTKTDVSVPTQ